MGICFWGHGLPVNQPGTEAISPGQDEMKKVVLRSCDHSKTHIYLYTVTYAQSNSNVALRPSWPWVYWARSTQGKRCDRREGL